MAEDIGSEFYGLPEYFVQRVVAENAGDGLVRAYHWAKRGSIFAPLFTAVLIASDLAIVGSDCRARALSVLQAGSGVTRN